MICIPFQFITWQLTKSTAGITDMWYAFVSQTKTKWIIDQLNCENRSHYQSCWYLTIVVLFRKSYLKMLSESHLDISPVIFHKSDAEFYKYLKALWKNHKIFMFWPKEIWENQFSIWNLQKSIMTTICQNLALRIVWDSTDKNYKNKCQKV